MRPILVTGAQGFVGRSLVASALSGGERVVGRVHEPINGVHIEGVGEFGVQPRCCRFERLTLVEGQLDTQNRIGGSLMPHFSAISCPKIGGNGRGRGPLRSGAP